VSEFSSVSALLDELAPEVGVEEPAWEDVLIRAALPDAHPVVRVCSGGCILRRRRSVFALAALAALALIGVAVAVAAGGLHSFSAWLTGSPGKLAPAADQSGFAHRNAEAFAQFPAGTKVRLLGTTDVSGKVFNLLGFRDGASLCLRVVRADLPSGRGANECASLTELEQSPPPAVVLDSPWFSFGSPALSASGVYGFADDTVKKIEVVRERSGTQTVPVRSNAFLALLAHPSGTVGQHPPADADPITGVFAVRADGSRVRLGYIAEGGGGTQTAPPKPPFYLGSPRIRRRSSLGRQRPAARSAAA